MRNRKRLRIKTKIGAGGKARFSREMIHLQNNNIPQGIKTLSTKRGNDDAQTQRLIRFAAQGFRSIFLTKFSGYAKKFGKINRKLVYQYCGACHYTIPETDFFLKILSDRGVIETNRMFIRIVSSEERKNKNKKVIKNGNKN